jgi:lysophospholipase L1-like esterase
VRLVNPAQVAVASLAVLLVSGLVSGCGAGRPTAHGATYAALGDSYSSGAGIAPVSDAACERSSANFGSLVAEELGYDSFEDVSCGGATTEDLTTAQAGAADSPQLDAVGKQTRLVTLTLGLNDQKLSSSLLYACLAPDGEPSVWCQQLLAAPKTGVDQVITAAAQRVEAALRAIHRKAPRARIVLVGYPHYLPDHGDCPDRLPLVPAMEPRIRLALELANERWREAADRVGADYVDTWTLTRGHDVCSADPWINGATTVPGKAAALHPFEAYHRAVAKAIVDLLAR